MIARNSAFKSNQSTAEVKKAKTKYMADLTGLLTVTTPIALMINSEEKTKNIINSIDIDPFS